LQVARRRTSGAFLTVPREFDIKPRVPSWGIYILATTLCTWSPDELAPFLSVIRMLFIPSEVTMELVNTIADHELCSQFTMIT
jgi:hypothetical protein